jgi:hypothetical protein
MCRLKIDRHIMEQVGHRRGESPHDLLAVKRILDGRGSSRFIRLMIYGHRERGLMIHARVLRAGESFDEFMLNYGGAECC